MVAADTSPLPSDTNALDAVRFSILLNATAALDLISALTILVILLPVPSASIVLFVSVSVELAVIPPISDSTSAVDLLSNPFAVNLAYSSSATLELSILTALVLLIPKVREACPPISLSTSLADLPSIDVPATLRKSSSATPLVR